MKYDTIAALFAPEHRDPVRIKELERAIKRAESLGIKLSEPRRCESLHDKTELRLGAPPHGYAFWYVQVIGGTSMIGSAMVGPTDNDLFSLWKLELLEQALIDHDEGIRRDAREKLAIKRNRILRGT